ncbi:MAG: glutamate-1-semialdehyde 2,1-aminomutase [Eubacteriales bacterium]|nr:glutamate-1-semialdehyde 2,1-aminomutase [Eubacteriales bacterium]
MLDNPETEMNFKSAEATRSQQLFAEASEYIPGGVNSPVRACKSVSQTPRFITRAQGCRIWDADGVERIDMVGSWGPMILGHGEAHIVEAVKKAAETGMSYGAPTGGEVELAKLICGQIKSVEQVRLVNSGTEAVMTAIRLARAYTGRDYIVKMDGCYHGHTDAMLIQAGSGLMTGGIPDSAGVPEAYAALTLRLTYNDQTGLRDLFAQMGDKIAAVIIEPAAANMGVVPPQPGYLQLLRDLTIKHDSLLIFDEVITGFRLSASGAQGYFAINPDLTVLGKIIGGGLPVGAVGGRRDIMSMLAPVGPVYQAGTLSGNPLAVAAGRAALTRLLEQSWIYEQLEQKAKEIEVCINETGRETGTLLTVNRCGSLLSVFFGTGSVTNDVQAQSADRTMYTDFYARMLNRGVYLPPSMFEAWFISAAHQPEDINHIKRAIRSSISELK